MDSKELIKLKDGQYQLTDDIYNYTLTVGRNKNKTKFYVIHEKGSSRYSANIFITQEVRTNEEGCKYKCLSGTAGVGGLSIHSDNIYFMLHKLKLVKSDSEAVS